MKDTDNKMEQKCVKELRKRMNELSSNIDCFDKISARAFPEQDTDFSDSEFIVSDLENVTGKRRTVPVLKWAAAAAAILLCIGILPKTAPFQNFLASISKNKDTDYRMILSEITEETENNDYEVYDMPLRDYIEKDVMVTPYYSCPFTASDKDTRVRIFVRKVGEYLTNQIYAAEYLEEYSEKNIIAVAESEARFTNKEIESLESNNSFTETEEFMPAARAAFSRDRYGYLTDKDGKRINAASFDLNWFFKFGNEIYDLNTQVLYGTDTEYGEKYLYDIISVVYDEENLTNRSIEIPSSDKLWKQSVRYDGSDDMPESSQSTFERTEYFSRTGEQDYEFDEDFYLSFFEPYVLAKPTVYLQYDIHTIKLGKNAEMGWICSPASPQAKRRMWIYLPYLNFMAFSSQKDPSFEIIIGGAEVNPEITVYMSDLEGGIAVGNSA